MLEVGFKVKPDSDTEACYLDEVPGCVRRFICRPNIKTFSSSSS